MAKVDFNQLTTAVDWSILQLETPRRKRVDAVRQYVGSHYAQGGTDKRVPTNFIELAATIYVRLLAANSPKANVTTDYLQLRPFAKTTELAINQIPDEIGLSKTLRRAVLEALFSVGIVKVGIASGGDSVLGHDIGEPFADVVTLDDYFCDMAAKSKGQQQFEGNDYWMSVDRARQVFNTNKLDPDRHTISGDRGEERAESISQDEGADLYREKVWLRDVYLPDTNEVVTYGVKTQKLLNEMPWDGPDGGPYHVLGYSDVPGNVLPLPPVALWTDLHDLGNALFRKLGHQADSKKSVAAFQGGDEEGIDALKRAKDGDGIRYNGQKPEMLAVGGIDQPTLAMFLTVQDQFNYFAGNLDSLGGLGPTSDTVGQDRLVSEAAGARAKDMANTTVEFTRRIFEQLAWYEWTDPARARFVEKQVYDFKVPEEWSDETRKGEFIDYNFDIDPYSMQERSPDTQLQKLGLIMQNYITPLLPFIQEQGGQVDAKLILEQVAELSNFPEVAEMVKFDGMPPEMVEPAGNPQPSMKPNETKRTYERINRPGATRSGKQAALTQTLMGGNVQPAEADAMNRRIG